MKSLSLIVLAAALLGVSCERHEFEGPNGSKQLHEESHGAEAVSTDHPEHLEKAEH